MQSESDRAWKIAHLATILASNLLKERAVSGLKQNPRLAASEFDPLFSAALKRASSLLSWAEGKGGDVYAYQLFQEGSVQTENQIVKTFQDADWADLKSKQPIMNLMQDVRSRFAADVDAEEERYRLILGVGVPELQEEIDRAIVAAFRKFSDRADQMDDGNKTILEDLRATLGERLYQHFATGTTTEHFYHLHQERSFLAWCFPDPSPGQQADRLYRPHEIFRRCAARRLLNEKLIRPRDQLTSSLFPFPREDLRREEYSLFSEDHDRQMAAPISEDNANQSGATVSPEPQS